MPQKIKIALSGNAGVGKGLVAELIQELCVGTVKDSFAAPIKQFLGLLLQLDHSHLYGELKEVPLTFSITPDSLDRAAKYYLEEGMDDLVSFDRMWARFCEVLKDHLIVNLETGEIVIWGLSSRRIQQLFGTEIMRFYDNDIWIKLLISKEPNIVDDLRFLNEEDKLRLAGYKVVSIIGKDSRITDEQNKKHQSEQEIQFIIPDYTLNNAFEEYNEDSVALLKDKVKDMLFLLYR